MALSSLTYAQAAARALELAMRGNERHRRARRRHRPRRHLRPVQRPAGTLRPAAHHRHAHLREHHPGRRRRHGAGRRGAGGRDAGGRLRPVRDGRDRQPGRQEPLHVRRPGPRAAGGAHADRPSGASSAAQHSQSLEAWFAHMPGLVVVCPGTAAGQLQPAHRGAGLRRPGRLHGTQGTVGHDRRDRRIACRAAGQGGHAARRQRPHRS
jgi:hypothetical protein